MTTDVTRGNFAQEVSQADGVVVVDYWADWCGPCKQMSPIIDELAREYEGRASFVKVDTSAEPEVAAEQGVMGLPTLQFWKDGQVVQVLSGGKSKNAIKKVIDELVQP